MSSYTFRANSKLWDSSQSLEDYIKHKMRNGSGYVYWATPQHANKIKVGDTAYIYRSGGNGVTAGVVAKGTIEEVRVDGRNRRCRFPDRLGPEGWAEANAKSPLKAGIRITEVYWNSPLAEPRPKGRNTVEVVKS